MKIVSWIIGIIVIGFFLVATGTLYILDESKQAVVTQFGKPIGGPITRPGLHVKMPFTQIVHYFEKRLLEWDGHPNEIPTKDKKYIWIDTTARWRIKDPLKFMQTVNNESSAQARLDDIIDAATRDYITSNNLLEAVRDTNNLLSGEKSAGELEVAQSAEALEKINMGRDKILQSILQDASKTVPQYGIELVDVRIKRINYIEKVREKVYERMTAERKRAAEQYRSEGQGEKAKIEGLTLKELQNIRSMAYKKAEEIKGRADAEAIKIYADAYGKDPDFYSFLKTLDTYKNTIDGETVLILSTEGNYYKYLKGN